MKNAAIAFALCAAAVAATPARACFVETPCNVDVYVAPYEADLPPPAILEMVKRREDGGLSLAGFYNEPVEAPVAAPLYDEPQYGDAAPHVIYSPWGRRRDGWEHDRHRFHAARIHAHIRRF